MTTLLLVLPWLALLAFLLFVVREPADLPAAGAGHAALLPPVSVIVPARDEASNVRRCLESLAASTYPDFEVVVVDDRSTDDTARLARAVAPGHARRILVMDGAELPEGWLGKPWACWQGARAAEGRLLLFTDADTIHEPTLLERAVLGLLEERADLLTVVGSQLMLTFWEKLVQPQVFFTMIMRFPRFEALGRTGSWRDAIANGQFMLFRREAYEAIGGHEAVKDEVVEDLVLAQIVKRAGLALRIRGAEDVLATRMYRSLPHLIEGWSKNIVMGGLRSMPPWIRPFVAPVSLAGGLGLWIFPPAMLVASLVGLVGSGWLAWSAATYGVSVMLWALFMGRMGAPWWYAPLYPLGAAVGVLIFVKSWVGGRRVVWKGRRYELPSLSDKG
jgi:chlorobactene glucosyltransferase